MDKTDKPEKNIAKGYYHQKDCYLDRLPLAIVLWGELTGSRCFGTRSTNSGNITYVLTDQPRATLARFAPDPWWRQAPTGVWFAR